MGKLVQIIVALALLWSGWWWSAATLLDRGIGTWLDDRRAEGWQAEIGAVDVAGFPLALGTSLETLLLADPVAGLAVNAESLHLSVPAYWPGDVTLTLPDTPLRIATPEHILFLSAPQAKAELKLHPGFALQLEQLSARSGPWMLNTSAGNLLSAEDLDAEVTQDAQTAESYRFAMTARGFAPGDLIRSAMLLPEDWPLAFDTLIADVNLRFDLPLGRSTIEDRRPQPRQIAIDRLDLIWGTMRLTAAGALEVNPQGIPDGEVNLRLENWRQLLDLVEKAGTLDARMRGQADLLLTALANMGGDPDTLDLTLTMRNGQMFLGPIQLGPAPLLILR